MLDIAYVREHVREIKENIRRRKSPCDIDALLKLDEERRAGMAEKERLQAELNKAAKAGPPKTETEREFLKQKKQAIKELSASGEALDYEFKNLLKSLPNLTHPDTPIGAESDFKVLETKREIPRFDFQPKHHEELMTSLGLIDFERGAKVAGSKFYFYKGKMVKLNMALLQYASDIASVRGYELMETPDLAKTEIVDASGFNPRGQESQIYEIKNHDLNLVGTAEITVLGYHADEILDLSGGPKKYAALSHCFRTEAGSYGKASQGLYRVHQFTKLELFVFCKPEDSEKLHQELLEVEKEICDGLEIPYRVIDIASGDLGGPTFRKFDIEAWMTMKNDYGEITSTSNCTDYQARRLNIRHGKGKKTELVHTLNGTAMVLSRFPVALIENHQLQDGSIQIPKALAPYFGAHKIS